MRKITIAVIIIVILGAGLGGTFLYFSWNRLFFNAGDRYDSTNLDFMDVIYENRSDIYAFNEGYSESNACPWGFEHNGIDYFLVNNSKVLAAAPGRVIESSWREYDSENRYHIGINIQYNRSLFVSYNFEPWTQIEADKDKQILMLKVQEGDWVEQGQEIARFLYVNEGAHIHFDVIEKNERTCPRKYFSPEGYIELIAMIKQFNPDWELCYP
ncbi:MAG: M23 family metallopeptidase [Candidatus Heimdallarchaeota archaeon]